MTTEKRIAIIRRGYDILRGKYFTVYSSKDRCIEDVNQLQTEAKHLLTLAIENIYLMTKVKGEETIDQNIQMAEKSKGHIESLLVDLEGLRRVVIEDDNLTAFANKMNIEI